MGQIWWLRFLLVLSSITLGCSFVFPHKRLRLTDMHSYPPERISGRPAILEFISFLHDKVSDNMLIKLTVDRPRKIEDVMPPEEMAGLREIIARYVQLRSGLRVQLHYKYDRRDEFKNVKPESVADMIKVIIQSGVFKQAVLETSGGHRLQLSISKPPGATIEELNYALKAEALPPAAMNGVNGNVVAARQESMLHDHAKSRLVSVDEPFLQALGVTTAEKMHPTGWKRKHSMNGSADSINQHNFRPKVGMADKFRQVEKFVAIVDSLAEQQFGSSKEGSAKSTGLSDHLGSLRGEPLRVVDMGSGLGYLTFAVHAHLRRRFCPEVVTVGVEQRGELVRRTTQVARELGEEFSGLSFVQASLGDYIAKEEKSGSNALQGSAVDLGCEGGDGETRNAKESRSDKYPVRRLLDMAERATSPSALQRQTTVEAGTGQRAATVDVLIALHACDTATDEAIWHGIQAGAGIIVVAPCCQKEVRRQMEKGTRELPLCSNTDRGVGEDSGGKENPLRECLEYGIYRERVGEMVTDTLRALYLQHAGYDVKVFEFISGEHTAKNVLITATKRSVSVSEKRQLELDGKIAELKETFGVAEQKLGMLMGL